MRNIIKALVVFATLYAVTLGFAKPNPAGIINLATAKSPQKTRSGVPHHPLFPHSGKGLDRD